MRRLVFVLALLMSVPASASAQHGTALRPDGTDIHYALSNRGADNQGVLLLLQGSGCGYVTRSGRLEWVGDIAPGHAILTIEKYGVAPGHEPEDPDDCSAEFFARDTLGQRTLDALTVLAALRREAWWDGGLVVFGGSEGGDVAAGLAPLAPETDALIVYSSGIGARFGDLVLDAVPPPVRPRVEEVFERARTDASKTELFSGHSLHYWSNAIDTQAVNALLDAEFPILIVHGERDDNAPVQTARASVEALTGAGRDVSYHEHAGLDHFMDDADGESHRDAVIGDIAGWLDAALGCE